MTTQAIEKIDQELKDFKGDKYAMVMKDRCSEVLKNFCQQDEECRRKAEYFCYS